MTTRGHLHEKLRAGLVGWVGGGSGVGSSKRVKTGIKQSVASDSKKKKWERKTQTRKYWKEWLHSRRRCRRTRCSVPLLRSCSIDFTPSQFGLFGNVGFSRIFLLWNSSWNSRVWALIATSLLPSSLDTGRYADVVNSRRRRYVKVNNNCRSLTRKLVNSHSLLSFLLSFTYLCPTQRLLKRRCAKIYSFTFMNELITDIFNKTIFYVIYHSCWNFDLSPFTFNYYTKFDLCVPIAAITQLDL